ncbi:MAG: hypothetical protein AB8I08_02410 [Sandaracinaceae bacterium]
MNDVIIVGMGQMGATFAHGLLRTGHSVHPVTRSKAPAVVAEAVPEPVLVLLAVGEAALPSLLAELPEPWRDRVALLQNELLPVDWRGYTDPTVAVVWFEKKKRKPLHPILSTPIAGPNAARLVAALEAIDLPAHTVEKDALLFELVRKNVYILTANAAGLEVGGTVGALFAEHRGLAEPIARDVLALQAHRAEQELPTDRLLDGLRAAFEADPEHGCRGRSAPARLRRALEYGRRAKVATPALDALERHLDPA